MSEKQQEAAPAKDLRIYDRDGHVVTQGAFNALLSRLESLEEDLECVTTERDNRQRELDGLYASLLQQPTSERCGECHHEKRWLANDGTCHAMVLSPSVAGSGMAFCGHRCVFPVTEAPQQEVAQVVRDWFESDFLSLENPRLEKLIERLVATTGAGKGVNVDAETRYQVDRIRARRMNNFRGTAEEWVAFEYGLPATVATGATTEHEEAKASADHENRVTLAELQEENARLKQHVANLNHDLESAVKHCNEHCGE
jgi:hypothetical protein